ncbi:MATE family efflux transporter [Pseudomonas marginalis]|uniref:MATE family efflux transporter n=1 Tax=Pseudomonas marginalis TaxID=298 RepID=UPI003BA0D5F1
MVFESHKLTSLYWRYAFPTVMAMLVSGLYQIVDGIFIGRFVGAQGLAAINMAWPWVGLLAGVGLMIGVGAGTHCSIAQGAGDLPRARQFLVHGVSSLVLMGAVVGFLIIVGREGLMALQGANEEVQQQGSEYLAVIGWFSPLVLASIAMPILVRNLGAPVLATVMVLVGAVTNILLDYVFIVELGWGLQGAAIATVIGESISAVIGLVFLWTNHSALPLNRFDTWARPRALVFRSIMTNGFSSLLMYLYSSIAVVLHNTALMHYGSTLDVAAYAIAGYLMMVYYLLAEGLASGMQPIISYFHGVGQREPIKKVFGLAMKSVVGTGIVFVIVVIGFPALGAWFFISDEDSALELVAVATVRLHLFALFLEGFLLLAAVYFQAIGKGKAATLITLANICIQLPFLFVLAPLMGVTGVLLALPLSTIVLALLVAVVLRRQFYY